LYTYCVCRIIDTCLKGFVSDHLIQLEILKEYDITRDKRQYCKQYGLSYDTISEILDVRKDYMDAMYTYQFISSTQDGFDITSSYNTYSNHTSVLTTILCSGVYPQISRVIRPPKRFLEVSGGNIERDVSANELKYYIPYRPDSDTTSTIESSDIVMSNVTSEGEERPMQQV
jgi:hypothetical protein